MVKAKHDVDVLEKCPTGIKGLDEITKGGLPKGRPTLICGSAGCGKTLFAMEFLMRGAMDYGEPGVFMTFEETPEDLAKNFISLGFDLHDMMSRGLIATDHVYIERSEIEETGEYDLEGLFIRLGNAIDSIGAKRVVLDTIEALFSGLSNAAIIRAELRRLFHWLKDRGVTAIVTGESGDKTPDTLRARRIRGRLRDPPRLPHRGANFHPPPAYCQVPRLISRRRRVSLPDRRERPLYPAHHFPGARLPRFHGAHRHGRPQVGCNA